MRKIIMLLMALCLHLAARGQTGYGYHYWFDNDRSTLQTGTSALGSWQIDADVSGLSGSLHSFHLQVHDADGNQSSPFTRYFIKATNTSSATGYYWFDNAVEQKHASDQLQGLMDIDVSHLTEGFHTLHYQVVGSPTDLSAITTRTFYKTYMPAQSKWHCWFDNDDATMVSGTDMSQTLLLDVSGLSDGYHVLHIQVEGAGQSASTPIIRPFIKIPQTIGVDSYTCLCMVDDHLFKQEKVNANQGVVAWNFDVSQLSQGFHRMFIQIVTPSGAASNTYEAFFLRETTSSEFAELKCVYAIDGAEFYTEAGTLAEGTFHFDIDVSSLEDGLHRIAYMLSNGKGVSTKAQTQFFIKTPLGGNGISAYWYWLNDNGDQTATKVVLPERRDPFSLISLLPIERVPLRSSQFEFRVEQGQPVVYAKNDFHLRFFDAAGRFTDMTRPYIDEREKQVVADAELLESGVLATTAIPAENVIKWYRLEAAPGDSLHFRLNRTATIQLFVPSGEEIYSASGYESVNWTGLHVFETGTYYLALHDVTATSGNDISIEYEHIDRYAVLRQDVAVVGNGGCSTITFDGNGFSDLYDVELFNEQGDIIPQLYIGHESNATTSVTFDFTGEPLGVYSARFRFTGEDKEFANLVTVEDARDIELATTVSYPSTFLQGTSTTYTIKITNKGNMTAYSVPIYTYIKNKNEKGISSIKYNGLGLLSFAETVSIEGMSEIDKDIIQRVSEDLSDDWQFLRFKVPDNDNEGDSVFVRSNYFFTNISPNATKEFTLTIQSTENVLVYVTVPPDWKELSNKPQSSRGIVRKSPNQDDTFNYCCIRESVECLANIAASRLDVAAVVASIIALSGGQVEALPVNFLDCAAGIGNSSLKSIGYSYCGDAGDIEDALNADKSWMATLIGCAGDKIGNIVGAAIGNSGSYGEIMRSIARDCIIPGIPIGTISDIYNCTKNIGKPSPGCPPTPPQGGPSTPVAPVDPNDIYGYTAESQSHAVKDGKTDVYYRIEFENDPEFATAPAHDIYVTDVLDGTKFDLSTFAPTRVQIGSKTAELTGEKNFVKTIDMRPEINAIAQVEGTFNEQTGTASWHISSLDPMTMEPTKYVMDGVLPVNTNGQGIGELWFDIELKPDLAHGTEVDNQASIVFDTNDAILTPTWTNTIDRVAPTSKVTNVQLADDGTATVTVEASDELSGPWRYDVYVQYGSGAWFLAAEHVEAGTAASVKVYEGMPNRFYSVATDMAGNVEQKEAAAELVMTIGTVMGDVNSDGKVTPADAIMILYHYFNVVQTGFNKAAADLNGDRSITPADAIEALYRYFGSSSSSRSVSPTTDDGRDPE